MRPTFYITLGNDEWKSVGDRSPCHEPLSPFDSLNYIRINPDPRLPIERDALSKFFLPHPFADCFHRDRTLVDTLVPAGGGGGGVRGGEGFDKCPGGEEDTRGFRKRVKTDSGETRTNRYRIYRFVADAHHGNYDEFFPKVIRTFRIHPFLPCLCIYLAFYCAG